MQHGSEISSLHWLASRLRIGFERSARTHQETIWTCLLRFGRRDLRIDERSVPNLWECGPARFHFSVSTQLGALRFLDAMVARSRNAETPRLGLHLVLGPDFPEMVRNFRRNLEEERCGVVQAVFQRVS